VAPSPNIPTVTIAQVYAGLCYFEGTNLSQGRGTTQPFEIVGAPFLDERWSLAADARNLPGATFREAAFAPTSNTYSGQVCRGVPDLRHRPGRSSTRSATAVAMLIDLKRIYPDFAWRLRHRRQGRPYWIDKLAAPTRCVWTSTPARTSTPSSPVGSPAERVPRDSRPVSSATGGPE